VKNTAKTGLFATIGSKILNTTTWMSYMGNIVNKKLLICGSILAVVLIVLASFTSVVGFQSTKSKLVDSPLFSIRTRRAIDAEEQDTITCEYVGKGKEIVIPLPIRDNRISLLNKVLTSIERMNDKQFQRFSALIINRIRQDNRYKSIDTDEIDSALSQLRENPKTLEIRGYADDGSIITSPIICWTWERTLCWPWKIIMILYFIIHCLLDIYTVLFQCPFR
jgi:hypothetical protein